MVIRMESRTNLPGLLFGNEKRAFSTGETINAGSPFRVATQSIISQHIVDLKVPMRIGLCFHQGFNQEAVALGLCVGDCYPLLFATHIMLRRIDVVMT